jgi:hypothetical protein
MGLRPFLFPYSRKCLEGVFSEDMPPGRCAGSRCLVRYGVVVTDADLESAVLPVRRRGFKSRRPL